MTWMGSSCMHVTTRLLLVPCVAVGVFGVPASAAGLHPEISLAASGLLGLGDLGAASRFTYGGDAALHVVGDRGLGLRAAGGMQLLRHYEIPTGEVIYNGSGTQSGKFNASQRFWWVAIGPTWSEPVASGRVDFYLMGGKAIARASSSQAWMNTVGSDPGSTSASLFLGGVNWSPSHAAFEFGAQLFAGGRAGFWNHPPAIVDNTGAYVLTSHSASITGVGIRVGYRLWGAAAEH